MSKEPRMESSAKITAQLEFTRTGHLHTILLNAETDGDQEILERALTRILNPGHLGWIRGLFRQP